VLFANAAYNFAYSAMQSPEAQPSVLQQARKDLEEADTLVPPTDPLRARIEDLLGRLRS